MFFWCISTCTWQIWIPHFSLRPPILGSCPWSSLRRNTVLDWTFIHVPENRFCRKRVYHLRRFPRIPSLCILSVALPLASIHLLSKTISRPFPSCVSCVSTLARFWHILIRHAFRLHLLGQVPKTSFLSLLPWRLSGVCRQTATLGRSRKFGDLLTADHKVLNKEGESRRNHPVRCRCWRSCHSMDSILSVPNKDFTRDGKEFTKVPRTVAKKTSYLHGQLLGNWKILWRSIMESSNLNTSSIRDGECKKELQQYCYNQAWMKDGGLVVWNAIAICEMSKTSWQMGKTLYERRFGEPSKGPIIPCGAMADIRFRREINQHFINLARKYYLESFLGVIWSREEFCKGDILMADLEDLEKVGRTWNLSSRNQRERSIDITKKRWIQISSSTGTGKIVRKRLRLPKAETDREEWRSQWRTSKRTGRVSTGRNSRWRCSPCRRLVDPSWLHFIVITMNLEFNSTCRRKKPFSIPLKYMDVTKVYSYRSGCVTRQEDRRLPERRFERETFVRFLERFHEVHSIERNTSQGIFLWSGRRQRFKRLPDQIMYGQKLWKVVKPLRIERNKNGQMKNQSSTMLEDWEEFTLSIQEYKEIVKNERITLERPMAASIPWKKKKLKLAPRRWLQSMKLHPRRFQNDSWLKSGISWIHKATSGIYSTHKTWRSHCKQRFRFDDPVQFGSQIYSYASNNEDSSCKSCSGQGMEKFGTIPAWQPEEVKSKKEIILEAQRDKKKVHFATRMDTCYLEKRAVGTKN